MAIDETKLDLNAMRHAVIQCDANIKIFQDAIDKENSTKKEYERIVKFLVDQELFKKKIIIKV